MLEKDLVELEADWKFKQSCGETELLHILDEAIGLVSS